MGYLRPLFPKMRSFSEHLRKSVGNLRKSVGKRGQGKGEKKEGGLGGGRQERKREGWVGDDVIKKNKKIIKIKIKK